MHTCDILIKRGYKTDHVCGNLLCKEIEFHSLIVDGKKICYCQFWCLIGWNIQILRKSGTIIRSAD